MLALPLRSMVPLSASICPANIFRNVDLPVPLMPTRPNRFSVVKVILTSLNSSLVPYDFSIFCKLITFMLFSYFVILLLIILHITIDSNIRPQ